MRKKTIAWFLISGIILTIIGYALYVPAMMSAASSGTASAGFGGTALIGLLLLAIGGILSFVAWIGTLVATAKQGRWGWFVCTFLFSWIAEVIYLFAGPGLPAKTAEPVQNIG